MSFSVVSDAPQNSLCYFIIENIFVQDKIKLNGKPCSNEKEANRILVFESASSSCYTAPVATVLDDAKLVKNKAWLNMFDSGRLFSEAEALDKLSVTIDILALDVSKHISSLTNHLKKTSS